MADPILLDKWSIRRLISRSLGGKWVAVVLSVDYETSPIAAIDGRIVTTRSGGVYDLGGDLSPLSAMPFHLADGTPYPPGATVDPVPPKQGSPPEAVHAHYGASAYVGLLPDGDYETYPVALPDWARTRAKALGARLFLDGVEVRNE